MKSINSQSDINVSRILRLIWQKNGISRIEIAAELGLDKSTVTKIVSALLGVGIVKEFAHGITGPQGGRKPIYLEIAEEFAVVGGIEIQKEGFVCCLLNLPGKCLFEYQEKMDTSDCMEIFARACDILKLESQKRKINLIGIGVGISGIINSDSGVIMKSISFEITELFPFTQIASVQAGVPVFIENDARCCCYSERTLMHDMGQQNSLFILIEMRKKSGKLIESNQVSVGAGLVINGKIFKGTEFSAGEFRSMLWTSGQHRQFQAEKENLEDFGAVLPDGAKTEDSIFNELAKHVAFLTNTLNLETVYIGGLESELEEKLVTLFKKRIELQWPYGSNHEVDVRLSSLGNLAVAYGAAGMFLDRFFALPSLSTPSGSGPSILESLSQVCETGHAGKLI